MKSVILYFYTSESSFVTKDLEILGSVYEIRKFRFSLANKFAIPATVLRQFFFIMFRLRRADIVLCQFAGLHAFLPIMAARIAKKKSVIIPGGTDCVSFPEIRYGNFSVPLNSWITKRCYVMASLLLPVHESLVHYKYTYSDNAPPFQGIKAFLPDIATEIEVIHNGYDGDIWKNVSAFKEEFSFVTVIAPANPRFTFKLKGIDLFTGMAEAFPQCNFYVIGGQSLATPEPHPNVHYLPNMKQPELLQFLSSKTFYVQLSISEGFPNGLSEAMMCECYPIVSAVGGMPFIVGDCGAVVTHRDQQLVNRTVQQLLYRTDILETGRKARLRILRNFSLAERKRKLLYAIRPFLR